MVMKMAENTAIICGQEVRLDRHNGHYGISLRKGEAEIVITGEKKKW